MLEINLATRIYIDNRKLTVLLSFSGAACILLVMVNLWLLVAQYQELVQIRSAIASGVDTLQKGSRQISEKDFQQLQGKVRFANGMLLNKGQHWLLMLDRLEQVVPDGVMLTTIEPDKKLGDSLKISGVALDFRKVRQLYETMGSGTLFKDVFLVSQFRVKVSEQEQGVTFSLTARVVK